MGLGAWGMRESFGLGGNLLCLGRPDDLGLKSPDDQGTPSGVRRRLNKRESGICPTTSSLLCALPKNSLTFLLLLLSFLPFRRLHDRLFLRLFCLCFPSRRPCVPGQVYLSAPFGCTALVLVVFAGGEDHCIHSAEELVMTA